MGMVAEQPASRKGASGGAGPVDAKNTIAVVDGMAVSVQEFSARINEVAGAVAMEELALDVLLEREMKEAGLKIAKSDIDAERDLLFQRIMDEAQVRQDQAGVLLEQFKRSRGLGPKRFAALLERNARLRAMVRGDVAGSGVTPAQQATALSSETGAKARARIIVVQTQSEASSIRAELAALTEPARTSRFASIALERSIDGSAPRGGQFGPVSIFDLSVPATVRESLNGQVGELSPVLSMDSGFAVVMVQEKIPALDPGNSQAIAAAEQKVRTRLERESMDRIANQLIQEARITLMDESLRWSWEGRPR